MPCGNHITWIIPNFKQKTGARLASEQCIFFQNLEKKNVGYFDTENITTHKIFRGELTDISAKKESLQVRGLGRRYSCHPICDCMILIRWVCHGYAIKGRCNLPNQHVGSQLIFFITLFLILVSSGTCAWLPFPFFCLENSLSREICCCTASL